MSKTFKEKDALSDFFGENDDDTVKKKHPKNKWKQKTNKQKKNKKK